MISYWLTHIVNGLSFGMLLFVLAAGLSLIFGLCRIVNLSHGSFYLLGGYIGFSTVRLTGSFPLAIGLAMLSMALLGILTERFLLRRYRIKPLAQVLLTFWSHLCLSGSGHLDLGRDPCSVEETSHAYRRDESFSASTIRLTGFSSC